MNSRSPYSQDDETDRRRGRSPPSRQDGLSSTQSYTAKKSMKDDQDMARTERARTKGNHHRSPDMDKSSDSYYSDDYDNTTYGSDRSPTPSSKALSPRVKKAGYKVRSVTPVHNRGVRKMNTKLSSNKKAPRWGFRSQSLNKESPPKDIDVVTKRVLSARLLKINELRNELTELQMKLEESQKENKALKRLQFRQEKALNKFEDTENEVSQLLSRHNNEMRTLKERLRKSQERERNAEKRLKDTEEELYRANVALKKLKQLSENKHLAEREELTKKVDLLESRLDDRDRRVRELEKNIELTHSSFQRQLVVEKKKVHEVQEENKMLKEELQRLTQKLRDKERELDAKNIYSLRLSKPSPKKDTEITPRKKGTSHSTSIGVQTNDSASWLDFPSPPPPPPVPTEDNLESEQEVLAEDNLAKQLKEEAEKIKREKHEAERLKRDREQAERKQAQEENLNRNREQKLLEDKARKLREEWEKEEFERRSKDLLNAEKHVKEESINRNEEERLKKELLLAKMFEIDHENKDPFYSDNSRPAPAPLLDTSIKTHTTDTKHKTYRFSEPTEKLFNGLPVHGGQESKSDALSHKNTGDTSGDFTFGSYTPSFGAGRSSVHNQRKEVLEEPIITTSKLDIHKDKKSSLMEQLFGNSSTATLPSISKFSDQDGLLSNGSRIPDQETSKSLPWEQSSKISGKNDVLLSGGGKISNSSKSRLKNAPGRTTIKAVNSVEDEIEELAL
ncbi:lebercilin [Hyla sarda]|uniref:lebercilin n=1 Tax=Hyla sarda TaxID=327740 RepID=UPI0024C21716|nr:lebercilin [Hyla sarda]XP_056421906.1 lebercilin [Hyla sarda]XP_056421907.1 lebercilin [Hyla sarda]XP_056421908.1 lebercilin [Hyla sarda]XP_056421909.1 lebercilin [Hyla sarda]XP_056421910.1 lebercilin [Hyla sarda]